MRELLIEIIGIGFLRLEKKDGRQQDSDRCKNRFFISTGI
jgi:hypothetical protein